MGDNVERIEDDAFRGCDSLRFVRVSKNLKLIGHLSFSYCYDLEILFLQSTLKENEGGDGWDSLAVDR